MRALCCRGLTREPFFRGVDLDLAAGETVVLHGPSGSGKTLFLRALADLDPTDAGTVALDDVERGALAAPAWRRRVLYVDGSAPRFDGTVDDNLARTARLGARAAVPVGLPRLDPTAEAERLSSGQAQLLALHRALVAAPEVLLLDEVTSALDPEAATAVEGVLSAWKGGTRALLWVSHDAALAGRLDARRMTLP